MFGYHSNLEQGMSRESGNLTEKEVCQVYSKIAKAFGGFWSTFGPA